MLKKNCHQVLGSQKSKLTPLELVFQIPGAINILYSKLGPLGAVHKLRHFKIDLYGSSNNDST